MLQCPGPRNNFSPARVHLSMRQTKFKTVKLMREGMDPQSWLGGRWLSPSDEVVLGRNLLGQCLQLPIVQ